MPRITCALILSIMVWNLAAPSARASLAREPLRRVLRQANPALIACREQHQLEAGRYQVSLVIDPTGKVGSVALTAAPTRPTPAAESCMAAAFSRLRFAQSYVNPNPPADSRTDARRSSRVPPDRLTRGRGTITVVWPFVFATRP